MASKDLSVIIPAYNEEDTIESLVEKLIDFLDHLKYELIIVEDGSNDSTRKISESMAEKFDNVILLDFEKRLGKGRALKKGFTVAKGKTLCFIDADMPQEAGEIIKLYEKIETGSDVAIGSRYHRDSDSNRYLTRKFPSKFYNHIAKSLLNTGVEDHQCGIKVFRREVWDSVGEEVDEGGWFWDTLFIKKAQNEGFKVEEVGIKWSEKKDSSLNLFRTGPVMMLKLGKTVDMEDLSQNRLLKFLSVGAAGALLNTVLLFALTEFTGLYYIYSSAISVETSIIAMFFFNNYFTFHTTLKGSEIISGIIRSNMIRSAGIAANIGLLYFFTEFIGLFYIISNIIAIALASILNYYGEKMFNWKE